VEWDVRFCRLGHVLVSLCVEVELVFSELLGAACPYL
jgi:hypothetical protein